jgi:hypothetical protein
VHDGTAFKPSEKQFVKTGGVWREIREVYVKQDGAWNLITGSLPAVFNRVGGNFGVASRPIAPEPPPPSGSPNGGGGGFDPFNPDAIDRGGSIVTDSFGEPVLDGSGGFVTSPGFTPGGAI